MSKQILLPFVVLASLAIAGPAMSDDPPSENRGEGSTSNGGANTNGGQQNNDTNEASTQSSQNTHSGLTEADKSKGLGPVQDHGGDLTAERRTANVGASYEGW